MVCLLQVAENSALSWEQAEQWMKENGGKWFIVHDQSVCQDRHSHVRVIVKGGLQSADGYTLVDAVTKLAGSTPR